MARPKAIRAPTAASLPNTLRIPSSTPSLIKSFSRLSRQALLDLVFQWLDDRNAQLFPPYLEQDEADNADDDELSPYPAAETTEDVRNAYQDLQDRKGGKREVIDRILEGDWRHGITLRQLAMVDIRYMEDHPASLRWTAFELSRISMDGSRSAGATAPDVSACLPRIHAATFLSNLQQQISPLVKAHYHLVRSASLPLSFLRILVTNSPYQSPRQPPEALTDSSRVMYVAFPDSCPFIYTSIATSPVAKSNTSTHHAVATDARSLQRIVRDALPKALSRPQERYALKATSLTAKNLQALLALRGPGRSNAANGAFSIFADAVLEGSPLDPRPSDTISPEEHFHQDSDPGKENEIQEDSNTSKETEPTSHIAKKRKLAVHSRFGTSGTLSSAPLDRLDVRLLDPPNDEDDEPDVDRTQPTVSLTFAGSDVISGIRKLAELGVVEPERMPSWMTGEEAVSVAVVHRGKRVIKAG
ncbi:CENP-N/CHL4 family protein [Aspergillus novofumigatus IBT 16806]|uniref:Putative CHL4 family chromosome segregation protein n=1 Tax=Aspergillus novofumigatus (strain IBT 16806) TaxID=1392255 RepID=A0A2I1C6B3_ASPN1|nr:putative CHL4 family chromosome segregation protein [Aspergillus novofumigatus IBT 16806]PKX93153.1 putative CHL4 family chromosome segregation protein [Aspergillus novofumigatus IBT 16806]